MFITESCIILSTATYNTWKTDKILAILSTIRNRTQLESRTDPYHSNSEQVSIPAPIVLLKFSKQIFCWISQRQGCQSLLLFSNLWFCNFFQDSDLLLSCGKDNKILCWNPNTDQPGGEVVCELATSSQWNYEVLWCPRNPGVLASSSSDGKIAVYSVMGGQQQQQQVKNIWNLLVWCIQLLKCYSLKHGKVLQ